MTRTASERATLLIVDDVASNIAALAAMLEDEYEILVATSGARALEMMSEGPLPDLILLDAMMPEMDGYAVCAALQADERTRAIPVIFVTARADPDSESQALRGGAADFVHKPVNKDVVRARVRVHLELKRLRGG